MHRHDLFRHHLNSSCWGLRLKEGKKRKRKLNFQTVSIMRNIFSNRSMVFISSPLHSVHFNCIYVLFYARNTYPNIVYSRRSVSPTTSISFKFIRSTGRFVFKLPTGILGTFIRCLKMDTKQDEHFFLFHDLHTAQRHTYCNCTVDGQKPL